MIIKIKVVHAFANQIEMHISYIRMLMNFETSTFEKLCKINIKVFIILSRMGHI